MSTKYYDEYRTFLRKFRKNNFRKFNRKVKIISIFINI